MSRVQKPTGGFVMHFVDTWKNSRNNNLLRAFSTERMTAEGARGDRHII